MSEYLLTKEILNWYLEMNFTHNFRVTTNQFDIFESLN